MNAIDNGKTAGENKMKALIICIALTLLPFSVAQAFFTNGYELQMSITAWGKADHEIEERFQAIKAWGYIIGVYDLGSGIEFQSPEGIMQGQVREVAVKYLKDHPELLHRPAAELLMEAFRAAWPMK